MDDHDDPEVIDLISDEEDTSFTGTAISKATMKNKATELQNLSSENKSFSNIEASSFKPSTALSTNMSFKPNEHSELHSRNYDKSQRCSSPAKDVLIEISLENAAKKVITKRKLNNLKNATEYMLPSLHSKMLNDTCNKPETVKGKETLISKKLPGCEMELFSSNNSCSDSKQFKTVKQGLANVVITCKNKTQSSKKSGDVDITSSKIESKSLTSASESSLEGGKPKGCTDMKEPSEKIKAVYSESSSLKHITSQQNKSNTASKKDFLKTNSVDILSSVEVVFKKKDISITPVMKTDNSNLLQGTSSTFSNKRPDNVLTHSDGHTFNKSEKLDSESQTLKHTVLKLTKDSPLSHRYSTLNLTSDSETSDSVKNKQLEKIKNSLHKTGVSILKVPKSSVEMPTNSVQSLPNISKVKSNKAICKKILPSDNGNVNDSAIAIQEGHTTSNVTKFIGKSLTKSVGHSNSDESINNCSNTKMNLTNNDQSDEKHFIHHSLSEKVNFSQLSVSNTQMSKDLEKVRKTKLTYCSEDKFDKSSTKNVSLESKVKDDDLSEWDPKKQNLSLLKSDNKNVMQKELDSVNTELKTSGEQSLSINAETCNKTICGKENNHINDVVEHTVSDLSDNCKNANQSNSKISAKDSSLNPDYLEKGCSLKRKVDELGDVNLDYDLEVKRTHGHPNSNGATKRVIGESFGTSVADDCGIKTLGTSVIPEDDQSEFSSPIKIKSSTKQVTSPKLSLKRNRVEISPCAETNENADFIQKNSKRFKLESPNTSFHSSCVEGALNEAAKSLLEKAVQKKPTLCCDNKEKVKELLQFSKPFMQGTEEEIETIMNNILHRLNSAQSSYVNSKEFSIFIDNIRGKIERENSKVFIHLNALNCELRAYKVRKRVKNETSKITTDTKDPTVPPQNSSTCINSSSFQNVTNHPLTETKCAINSPSSKHLTFKTAEDTCLDVQQSDILPTTNSNSVVNVNSISTASAMHKTYLPNELSAESAILEPVPCTSKTSDSCIIESQQQHASAADRINDFLSIESIQERKEVQVKKLEKLLADLDKMIKRLQKRELSLDDLDSEESAYIEEERYKKRFNKVWETLCKLKKRSVRSGRHIEKFFSYAGTRFGSINKAVEKCINKKKPHAKFPDYSEIFELLKNVNEAEDLGLSESYVAELAKTVFHEVGSDLKKRRLMDEAELLGCYLTDDIADNDDPAEHDEELKNKLMSSLKKGEEKIEELIDKYVEKQVETNSQPEVVNDNDDEDAKATNSEDEESDKDLPDTEPATPEVVEDESNSENVCPIPEQPKEVPDEIINLSPQSAAPTEPNSPDPHDVITLDDESSGDLPPLEL